MTHDCKRDGDDIAINSIGAYVGIGSETTCAKPNELKMLYNQGEEVDLTHLPLSSLVTWFVIGM